MRLGVELVPVSFPLVYMYTEAYLSYDWPDKTKI